MIGASQVLVLAGFSPEGGEGDEFAVSGGPGTRREPPRLGPLAALGPKSIAHRLSQQLPAVEVADVDHSGYHPIGVAQRLFGRLPQISSAACRRPPGTPGATASGSSPARLTRVCTAPAGAAGGRRAAGPPSARPAAARRDRGGLWRCQQALPIGGTGHLMCGFSLSVPPPRRR
jgi:hypothetical protein